MDNIKGGVRNVVVSNRELFCDMLARTLCKMQVQYVQVDNEFHFNDKILRFYTLEECLELSGKVSFVCFDKDKIVSLDPQSLLFVREQEDLNRIFLTPGDDIVAAEDVMMQYHEEGNKGFSYTKKKRQQDNRMINQRLKQNSNMNKRYVNHRKNHM